MTKRRLRDGPIDTNGVTAFVPSAFVRGLRDMEPDEAGLRTMLVAARKHGLESGPDCEVKDLHALINQLWGHVAQRYRASVVRSLAHDLGAWTPEWFEPAGAPRGWWIYEDENIDSELSVGEYAVYRRLEDPIFTDGLEAACFNFLDVGRLYKSDYYQDGTALSLVVTRRPSTVEAIEACDDLRKVRKARKAVRAEESSMRKANKAFTWVQFRGQAVSWR